MIRKITLLTMAGALCSCAAYHPEPLGDASAVLAAPDMAVISQQAQAIDRPFLTPTAIDLSQPLTPDAVAALAVLNNPDLKAQRVRAGVSDAQVFAAGLLPDPSISLGASKVVSGPDPLLDLASAFGLDINSLRTRGISRARARAEARQVRLDLAWAEWQTAEQARMQAVRVTGLQRVVALAQESSNIARSLVARTQHAAGRGDISGDRVQASQLATQNAITTLRSAQKSVASAKSELEKLLGLPPRTALRLADTPLPAPPPATDTLSAIARANRTDLQALQAGYRAQEAAVHKAVLDQFPSLNLTINNNRDSAGNYLLGPAVDLTLPLWNRNRGGIAVERATRAALRSEYEARLFQTRADIAAAVAAIAVARQQRADAMQGLEALRHYAQASARAAKRGDLSLETAQTNGQSLRDREILIAQSDEDIREQMIALELLTGAPREAWRQ